MDGIRHSRQFAEIERLVSDYFHCHLAPVMSKTQAFLTKKQGEEMREYSTSLGGILSAMASAAQPMGDPYQVLKVTGEWNSKTTEDYIGMCKAEITGSKEIQQDLAYMAGQWRDTVVREIGRERYNELSEQLGGDLAYAYMDYRVEELMIDRLVKERMPKSSADYIIRKAAESSLLGLSQTLNRSPLAEEIEARGEAAYRPKGWEKGAGRVLGATADAVMMNTRIKRMSDIERWAKDVYSFVSGKYGEQNIAAFIVHLDELNPHVHCTLLPIKDGRFAYKEIFAGKDKFEYSARMKQLHTDFFAEVNTRWGMSRGTSISETGARHRTTEEYRRILFAPSSKSTFCVPNASSCIRLREPPKMKFTTVRYFGSASPSLGSLIPRLSNMSAIRSGMLRLVSMGRTLPPGAISKFRCLRVGS